MIIRKYGDYLKHGRLYTPIATSKAARSSWKGTRNSKIKRDCRGKTDFQLVLFSANEKSA